MDALDSGQPHDDGMTQSEESHAKQPDGSQSARYQCQLKILFAILLVVIFLVYGFTTHLIPSLSMEPTLKPGDHILTMRSWLAYPGGRLPARGDIIVFQWDPKKHPVLGDGEPGPVGASESDQGGPRRIGVFRTKGEVLIKRVAAIAGDKVQVRDDEVFVNGKRAEAPGAPEKLAADDSIGSRLPG